VTTSHGKSSMEAEKLAFTRKTVALIVEIKN
jgi:hypothetical protein